MRPLVTIWDFIAGDSRRAPLGVAAAIAVTFALLRAGASSGVAASAFAAVVALSLGAAVFERR